ncbi:hypothetical protein QEZ54_21215 [Catellatospora sp. KI3]|nr:hypothetical protein [Catellatospora sp. KI3]MDI1463505.1 hypothetical protein [Catellatospora sp. KI3]
MIATRIVDRPYGFCTAGYAEGFLRDWWDQRRDPRAGFGRSA